jgi:hypothetical protein
MFVEHIETVDLTQDEDAEPDVLAMTETTTFSLPTMTMLSSSSACRAPARPSWRHPTALRRRHKSVRGGISAM